MCTIMKTNKYFDKLSKKLDIWNENLRKMSESINMTLSTFFKFNQIVLIESFCCNQYEQICKITLIFIRFTDAFHLRWINYVTDVWVIFSNIKHKLVFRILFPLLHRINSLRKLTDISFRPFDTNVALPFKWRPFLSNR